MSGPAFHWEGRTYGPYLRKREGAVLLQDEDSVFTPLLTDLTGEVRVGSIPLSLFAVEGKQPSSRQVG